MSEMKTFLSENPKMMGALFTLFLLLTQAGNAVATSAAISGSGP